MSESTGGAHGAGAGTVTASTAAATSTAGTAVGRVGELWTFPVKSTQGVRHQDVDIAAAGLAGDREWAVHDAATGEVLTAAQSPSLREVEVAWTRHDQAPSVRLPDEGSCLGRDATDAALSRHLGRPVRLVRAAERRHVDVAPVHLVSGRSLEHARTDEHAISCACSVEDPRANVLLALDADAPSERDLVGRDLLVGAEVVLRLIQRPDHCLGVYAEVVRPGQVRAGDEVRVL
ncbi:MAG: MOSC N-terminal beta barrel domain-containing protein [Motilibacteraceae bacterium]